VPDHVGAELAVCEVAVGKRAAMEHDRELGRRDDQPLDAADRASRSVGGEEHGRVAATVLEDLNCVNAGGRPGRPRWRPRGGIELDLVDFGACNR
jgi:hypothetical protein